MYETKERFFSALSCPILGSTEVIESAIIKVDVSTCIQR